MGHRASDPSDRLGRSRRRLRLYRSAIAWQWASRIWLLGLWAWLDRPFAWIGLVAPAGRAAWITAALCIATLVFFAMQIRRLLTSADTRAAARAQLDRSGPGVQTVPRQRQGSSSYSWGCP
jgi:hypothetical protein